MVLNFTLIVPFENDGTLFRTATGKYANCFALSISSSFEVPYSLRALSISSLVGLSLLATHGRPSTITTLSAPSWAITHVPTIGVNVVGGRPTVSLLRSTFTSAATTVATSAIVSTPNVNNRVMPCSGAESMLCPRPRRATRRRRSPPLRGDARPADGRERYHHPIPQAA